MCVFGFYEAKRTKHQKIFPNNMWKQQCDATKIALNSIDGSHSMIVSSLAYMHTKSEASRISQNAVDQHIW